MVEESPLSKCVLDLPDNVRRPQCGRGIPQESIPTQQVAGHY